MSRSEGPQGPAPTPRAAVLAAGAFFAGLAAYNLFIGGSDFLTIFLSSASLLCLGVDVSKVMGRK